MEGYNGYRNYETWNCSLWLNNDESSYMFWKDAAADALKSSRDKKDAVLQLMNQMKEAVENDYEEFLSVQKNGGVSISGMFCDLLKNAISKIDFYEVASSFIEEAEE